MEQILEQVTDIAQVQLNTSTTVYPSLQDTIRIKFKTLLNAKCLNQTELGCMLGVSKGYISQIINSKRIITTEMKIKLARFLGVDSRVIWP
jgi:antitoxin component HigA of HigAB toxin-antitoxin module